MVQHFIASRLPTSHISPRKSPVQNAPDTQWPTIIWRLNISSVGTDSGLLNELVLKGVLGMLSEWYLTHVESCICRLPRARVAGLYVPDLPRIASVNDEERGSEMTECVRHLGEWLQVYRCHCAPFEGAILWVLARTYSRRRELEWRHLEACNRDLAYQIPYHNTTRQAK